MAVSLTPPSGLEIIVFSLGNNLNLFPLFLLGPVMAWVWKINFMLNCCGSKMVWFLLCSTSSYFTKWYVSYALYCHVMHDKAKKSRWCLIILDTSLKIPSTGGCNSWITLLMIQKWLTPIIMAFGPRGFITQRLVLHLSKVHRTKTCWCITEKENCTIYYILF